MAVSMNLYSTSLRDLSLLTCLADERGAENVLVFDVVVLFCFFPPPCLEASVAFHVPIMTGPLLEKDNEMRTEIPDPSVQ